MRSAFINGRILIGPKLADDHVILVESGRISAILPAHELPSDCDLIDLKRNRLLPGFVDLQVNGGGGALFNDDPSVEALKRIAAAHSGFGTTALLPTLITDDLDKIDTAITAVNEAIAQQVPGVVGIHIEGPFINIERKGIHDERKIRMMDATGLERLSSVRGGRTLVTLAPELVQPDHIRQLVQRGILLCAGHTNGSYQEIASALNSGVTGITHLFNAMSQLTAREPGAVGAALAHPSCWCGIIVDGHHVHPATLKLAIRAKGGIDRFFLISDAMPSVGQAEKRFMLNGDEVRVIDGVCRNGEGVLAGSDLDMAQATANAMDLLGLDIGQASRMASANPAELLGMRERFGALEAGLEANMAELDDHGAVVRTWIGGRLVWERNAVDFAHPLPGERKPT